MTTPTTIRPLTVRRASVADAPMLADLGARTFWDTYHGLMPDGPLRQYIATYFDVQTVAGELGTPGTVALVAELSRVPVGYAITRYEPPPSAGPDDALRLGRVYVDSVARGQGVGTALLDAVVDLAAIGGHDAVWLTVWERNRRAIDVYERWDFVDVAEDRFEFGGVVHTDRVMMLTVGQLG
jgi:diamine N-acetyltransferase